MKLLIILLFVYTVLIEATEVREFIKANNLFASTIYKEILKRSEGNFLVSPFSAETVLAFGLSGCKGETAQEIQTALHLPNDTNMIESGVKRSLPKLKSAEYILYSANKMYVQENFPINEEFKKVAVEVYQADSENIDFTKHTQAVNTINKWVEEKTNNKIRNIINSADIDNSTKIILINALYFKGDWLKPFNQLYTEKALFYKNARDTAEVEMMHNFISERRHFSYYESSQLNAKFLKLPFIGADATMTIILPNEKEGLATLENQIESVFKPQNFTEEPVRIALPKFRIESTIDFKEILDDLGVQKAFNSTEADLSGIGGQKGDLSIDKIIQKTFMDVSEQGVEAGASTYAATRMAKSSIKNPPEFIADHPFIFYVKFKDAIMFVGRFMEPK